MINISNPLEYFIQHSSNMSKEEFELEMEKKKQISQYNKENAETWYGEKHRYLHRQTFQNSKNSKVARKLGHTILSYQLPLMYDLQNGKCAITGVELNFNKDDPRQASLDRIISEKGYHLHNVWLVSLMANYMKNKFTLHEVMQQFPHVKEQPIVKHVFTDLQHGRIPTHNDSLKPLTTEQDFIL